MDDVQEMRVEGMILPSRSSQYNLENELPVEGKKKKKRRSQDPNTYEVFNCVAVAPELPVR